VTEGAVVEGQADAPQLLDAGQVAAGAPGETTEAVNGEARRDPRRSRDRYGRDRRERSDREGAPAPEAAPQQEATAAEPGDDDHRPRYATGFVSEDAAQPRAGEARPVARERQPAAPAVAPIAVQPAEPKGLPKVQPFQLPVDDLAQVAASSGLQWVNSDAGKIAAVQAAIAAEPKPIRVPRERPPVVVIDEGPLVLVETRRDLRDMKLPFEQQPPQGSLQ
jgi:ribonuclease E